MKIIQKRKWWFALSGTLAFIMLVSLLLWGLKPAIDFTGGTLLELQVSNEEITTEIVKNEIINSEVDDNPVVQTSGENRFLVRLQPVNEEAHSKVVNNLKVLDENVEELRFEFIGPAIGQELKSKAIYAIIFVIIAIILYVAWAFRKVSYQVSSWKYGVIAVIALIHDILIVV